MIMIVRRGGGGGGGGGEVGREKIWPQTSIHSIKGQRLSVSISFKLQCVQIF